MPRSPLLKAPPIPARELLDRIAPRGVRLGLEPFRALLEHLGNPQDTAPIVLVGGTNGKGTVTALVDSALRAAGYRVLRSTSPHLVEPHERISIAGNPIQDAELAAHLHQIEHSARTLSPPTYFEALIAASLLAAREHAVDAIVLEVGMGGRLDATNATEPLLSVVTRVGLDHTRELGPTLGAIAGEKAGIFRSGRPAVVGEQPPAAWAVLATSARRIGAEFVAIEQATRVEHSSFLGLEGHDLSITTAGRVYRLRLRLAGAHQIENARTALVACERLARFGFPALDQRAIEAGFEAVHWPARLESFRLQGRDGVVLLDAAHNPDGCAALGRFLAALGTPYRLLFGCLADKPARDLLAPLLAGSLFLITTTAASPRATDAAELARLAGELSSIPVVAEPDPEQALELLLKEPSALAVVAGSIYLVGPLRSRLVQFYRARSATSPGGEASPQS